MLVFIPVVGEFVIPELLGGPGEHLIDRQGCSGRNLQQPRLAVASALCHRHAAIPADIPIILSTTTSPGNGEECIEKSLCFFSSIMLLCSGSLLSVSYSSPCHLVIYSFKFYTPRELVTVWGGWSEHWYVGLLDNNPS